MSIVDEYIEREYGIKVTDTKENPVVPTGVIGTTPVMLLRENPNRILWIIINLSANIVYLAFSTDPSATKGILLTNGEPAASQMKDDLHLTQKAVWGVASVAASAIYVLEVEAVA